jgi:hypothetical protein
MTKNKSTPVPTADTARFRSSRMPATEPMESEGFPQKAQTCAQITPSTATARSPLTAAILLVV